MGQRTGETDEDIHEKGTVGLTVEITYTFWNSNRAMLDKRLKVNVTSNDTISVHGLDN